MKVNKKTLMVLETYFDFILKFWHFFSNLHLFSSYYLIFLMYNDHQTIRKKEKRHDWIVPAIMKKYVCWKCTLYHHHHHYHQHHQCHGGVMMLTILTQVRELNRNFCTEKGKIISNCARREGERRKIAAKIINKNVFIFIL